MTNDIQTELDELDTQISSMTQELDKLKEKAAKLRFACGCKLLGMKRGDVADVTMTTGKVFRFVLTNADADGNPVLSIEKPLLNYMGQRSINVGALAKGLYNGIDRELITKVSK